MLVLAASKSRQSNCEDHCDLDYDGSIETPEFCKALRTIVGRGPMASSHVGWNARCDLKAKSVSMRCFTAAARKAGAVWVHQWRMLAPQHKVVGMPVNLVIQASMVLQASRRKEQLLEVAGLRLEPTIQPPVTR